MHVCTAFLKHYPIEMYDHTFFSMVVSAHKSCCSLVNYLQFINVFLEVWLPDLTGVLESRSNDTLARQFLDRPFAAPKVTSKHAEGAICFRSDLVNVI